MSTGADSGDTPFRYNLELTPGQLKVTHEALRAAHEAEPEGSELAALLQAVLAKLPDAAQIDSIRLPAAPGKGSDAGEEPDDGPASPGEPPPVVA